MQFVRRYFPFIAGAMLLAALAWAIPFNPTPPAEFSFGNGDEPKTIDPALATGAPEGRILNALFEGLLRSLPDEDAEPNESGMMAMKPQPAMAESYTISDDGKVYTFKIRKGAVWSNDEPVTAHDFLFSWQRTLHPETASEYAYQLHYIVGAQAYNFSQVKVGDQVEVELRDRPDPVQLFPRGTIERGILREIILPPTKPEDISKLSEEKQKEAKAVQRASRTFVVDVKPEIDGKLDLNAKGVTKRYQMLAADSLTDKKAEACVWVLPDFAHTGGIKTLDDHTLEITLNDRTAFFADLVAFYPLYPVNRTCVEEFGTPNWTKAANIVNNGPFNLEFRRIRDRIRLKKSETYWNADNVSLNSVDVRAVKSENTSLNMYMEGDIDWSTQAPSPVIPDLKKRDDFHSAPMLSTYFYRLNVNAPPLNDVRVRRALNMAIDKKRICEKVTKAGQVPARSFVPPGMNGYPSNNCLGEDGKTVDIHCGAYDVEAARKLLAEAGYPNGAGLPKIEILYNSSEGHKLIAEVVQQDWKNNLGVDIQLKNVEWASFLQTTSNKKYQVARAGWIGDYPDPNTFLDMFVTDGPNNQTNWSNKEYDDLIKAAQTENDPTARLCTLQKAESILMKEQPIIPFYFYVSVNLVNPKVKGFYPNIQDLHPLTIIRIED